MLPLNGLEARPFLVYLDAGDGTELLRLAGDDEQWALYSRFVGFNFKPDPEHPVAIPARGVDLFSGPVRFTHCLHIPWVIYCANVHRAREAVRLHGHPKSRVYETKPARNNIYTTFYELRNRNTKSRQ